jgi:cupin fold WbuC family metalloprotein
MDDVDFKKVNDDVFLAQADIVKLDARAIHFVKDKAHFSAKKRARICAHKQPDDSLHEMVIAILAESYIRPHRHHNKIESFHLIEGEADVIIFYDDGTIQDVVPLGGKNCFYYRLNFPAYHTLIIHSPILVIHEITNGPFDVSAADYAIFSPHENDKDQVNDYLSQLKKKASDFLNR